MGALKFFINDYHFIEKCLKYLVLEKNVIRYFCKNQASMTTPLPFDCNLFKSDTERAVPMVNDLMRQPFHV
ncbi:hypothetical protein DT065_12820 [Salicibibacter kimchii]|uniref:Uncharacterized protein n=1 Tax=Salicibibacter kimchii TaxID=2099786 RepID=A0A345C0R7_9BACI|nr:hypothetical protein DT065_12820 [Salicibibacter kimchii]